MAFPNLFCSRIRISYINIDPFFGSSTHHRPALLDIGKGVR
jgi:hypothetical protein